MSALIRVSWNFDGFSWNNSGVSWNFDQFSWKNEYGSWNRGFFPFINVCMREDLLASVHDNED